MSTGQPRTDGSESATPPEELGFSGCMDELDQIVRGLEADSIDVDHLAASVERSAELVEWCRAKLAETRLRVDEVLPRLELGGDGTESASDDATEDG